MMEIFHSSGMQIFYDEGDYMTPKYCNDCVYKSRRASLYGIKEMCVLYGRFKKGCKEKIRRKRLNAGTL